MKNRRLIIKVVWLAGILIAWASSSTSLRAGDPAPYCGDGICQRSWTHGEEEYPPEDCVSCELDCSCYCGDSICSYDHGEECDVCGDCGPCITCWYESYACVEYGTCWNWVCSDGTSTPVDPYPHVEPPGNPHETNCKPYDIGGGTIVYRCEQHD